MTPEDFILKWRGVELSELAASHDHFNELCELLEIGKPTDEDPKGHWFAFEKPVPKGGKAGGAGFADVWRSKCFVWEYKRKKKYNTLAAAIAQARDYASLLDNPPLAIACDIDEIQIRTLFTGSVSVTHTIRLLDLNDVGKRQLLRCCFTDPNSLRPDITPQAVTEEAARKFATLAQNLRERRDRIGQFHDARRVAHFLNKIVFCLFAEDAGLLPGNVFSSIVEEALRDKTGMSQMLADLFDKMRTGKGYFGAVRIPWFNGGLFDDDDVLELLFPEVQTLGEAMRLDWASIEPVIFGTLFERGLDPARRKQMAGLFDAVATKPAKGRKKKSEAEAVAALPLRGGATAAQRSLGKGVGIHYTDSATILKIVEPVVLRPLASEWAGAKAQIAKAKGTAKKDGLYLDFRERLGAFRILDPACGSGNFLYLALRHLKDFDRTVEQEGKALGVTADPKGQRVTPKTVMGIEVNPYAAELARVTVWIGELQWQMSNGYGVTRRPILGALDSIENRDALLNPDGTKAEWPGADAIIGNPPFLGNKKMLGQLGDPYVERLREFYSASVPKGADLVCYWFALSSKAIADGHAKRFGLVATNSIRDGANRMVLKTIAEKIGILEAWSDEPWVIDGAAVRVSLVVAGSKIGGECIRLNGQPVAQVYSNLTSGSFDVTRSARLAENEGTSFQGVTKGGAFEISGATARNMLLAPTNPNGLPNAEVIRPIVSGGDLAARGSDSWVIDFDERSEANAALFEMPFEYIRREVRPIRIKNRREGYRRYWWRLAEHRPGMKQRLKLLSRYLATPKVSKHRFFVWLPTIVLPDNLVIAIAKEDDLWFGLCSSRLHELWSLRQAFFIGAGNDPTYTPTSTFETFPFPDGLIPNVPVDAYVNDARSKRVALAADTLNKLRENWLSPANLVKHEPEVVLKYPGRVLPKSHDAAEELKKRTLTNLYNERPAWLAHAHHDLDRAVAAAYGWPEELADRAQPENPDPADRKAAEEEILKCLFDLNQERAKAGR